MASNSRVNMKFLGAALGVTIAAVAVAGAGGGVVQPMASQCGVIPPDCHTWQCNTATGEWRLTGNKVNGTACNDGNSCTTADKCQSGICAGTPPVLNLSHPLDGEALPVQLHDVGARLVLTAGREEPRFFHTLKESR